MPRIERVNVGNYVYHVLNRANARVRIFDNDDDYALFDQLKKVLHMMPMAGASELSRNLD